MNERYRPVIASFDAMTVRAALALGAKPLLRELRELAGRARIALPAEVDEMLADGASPADGTAPATGAPRSGRDESATGRTNGHSDLVRTIAGDGTVTTRRMDTFGLSGREREVLALVAQGLARSKGSFTASQGLYIGVLWLGLTLAFEFTFGRFVQHKSWIELLEAYAFKEGNLWPLVLVVVLLAPLAAALWQAKSARAALAALAVLVLAAWTPEAAALDRAGAIEAAKRQMGSRCNAATPCGFEAKLEGDRWHVRVEFLKDDTAPGKPAAGARTHAIYIFNQSGRVVGTIKGK